MNKKVFERNRQSAKKNVRVTQVTRVVSQPQQPKEPSQILRHIKMVLQLLIIVAIIFGCVKLGFYLKARCSDFPVEKVKIIAPYKYVSAHDLQRVMGPLLQNGFLNLNLVNLKQQILTQLPWVNAVTVKRAWPSVILIKIIEQQPIANWKNVALLNQDGNLFTPRRETYPTGLPVLSGPDEQVALILQNYQKMQIATQPLGWKIIRIDVDKYLSWHILLDSGVNIFLGSVGAVEQFQGLVAIYPQLKASHRSGAIQSIDLRYKNGLAVKWN